MSDRRVQRDAKESDGSAAQRGHCFGFKDQAHPKRAGAGQDRPLAQADFQRLDLGIFSAGFDDACHQPLLRLLVACARQHVDVPDRWVIVEYMQQDAVEV